MRTATKVCIAVTVTIVLCLLLIPPAANINISPALGGIGIFFLAGIPWYVLYRKFCEMVEIVWDRFLSVLLGFRYRPVYLPGIERKCAVKLNSKCIYSVDGLGQMGHIRH